MFRARDTKLDRDVAIKVLPEAFAQDTDRLARFTREAKTLASLNHPNIAGIYGLEEIGGVTALVMELVDGDGRELFFLAPSGAMMAVDVTLGETPEFGQPRTLFDTRLAFSFQTDQYAVSPDGQRFLFMDPQGDRRIAPLNVVLNWPSLLNR